MRHLQGNLQKQTSKYIGGEVKAADRCTEHNQGDRCVFGKGHEDNHVGKFTVWNDATGLSMKLYPRTQKRNRAQAREDKYRKSWIKNVTRSIRLDALRELYLKSFKNKPQEKTDALRTENVDVPSIG